jgi:hypothetical protein
VQLARLLLIRSLDILAHGKRLPQIPVKRCLLLQILVAKQRRNRPSSFFSMVEWNTPMSLSLCFRPNVPARPDLRKHVVDHVILDDAVEDVPADPAHLTVNCRERAKLERPRPLFVVGRVRVCVMEVSDGN